MGTITGSSENYGSRSNDGNRAYLIEWPRNSRNDRCRSARPRNHLIEKMIRYPYITQRTDTTRRCSKVVTGKNPFWRLSVGWWASWDRWCQEQGDGKYNGRENPENSDEFFFFPITVHLFPSIPWYLPKPFANHHWTASFQVCIVRPSRTYLFCVLLLHLPPLILFNCVTKAGPRQNL